MYPSVAPHMLQLGDGMGLPWPMTDRCMFPRVAIFIFWSKDGCCICFWSLKQLACDPGCMLTWPSKRKSRLDCSNGDCPSTNRFCLTPEWACYCTFMLDSCVSYGWSPNCVGWHWGWLHFLNCPKNCQVEMVMLRLGVRLTALLLCGFGGFCLVRSLGRIPLENESFWEEYGYAWCPSMSWHIWLMLQRDKPWNNNYPRPKKKTNTILKDVSPIENGGFSFVILCLRGGVCESTWHQWTFHVVPSPCKMLNLGVVMDLPRFQGLV